MEGLIPVTSAVKHLISQKYITPAVHSGDSIIVWGWTTNCWNHEFCSLP